MPEDTQIQAEEASASAGTDDFCLHLERFEESSNEGRTLRPYQTIGQAVVIGFQSDAGLSANIERDKQRNGLRLRVDQIGESKWLSLEVQLEAADLEAVASLFWSLTATALPRAAYRLILRIGKNDETTIDFPLGTGAIGASPTCVVHACAVPEQYLQDLSAAFAPRIIMLLPLNEAIYDLKRLAFAPARNAASRTGAAKKAKKAGA